MFCRRAPTPPAGRPKAAMPDHANLLMGFAS
jgi:hypothetical protein